MLDRATQLLRCSRREGGCVTRPFGVRVTSLREMSEPPRGDGRCATNGALQSSPSRARLCMPGPLARRARVRRDSCSSRLAPRSAALLGADHSRPDLPAPSLAGSGGLYSATHATADVRREGSALTGRMGAGEQRSEERVCPAACRRVGEKALCSGPFRADAESSQPPSRNEQRSVPSPQARAATAKPRQGTALAPRANPMHGESANVRNGPRAASRRPHGTSSFAARRGS
jgi:hypothetical protein